MLSLPSIKVLVGVIAAAMLMTACATQNANTGTNANTSYYGVPAMYPPSPSVSAMKPSNAPVIRI